MCDCDEFEFTINRGDEFMVLKTGTVRGYRITPENLWKMLDYLLEEGAFYPQWNDDYTSMEFDDFEEWLKTHKGV